MNDLNDTSLSRVLMLIMCSACTIHIKANQIIFTTVTITSTEELLPSM